MYRPATDWNPKQALFKEAVKKKERFQEAMKLCLDLHSLVHLSRVSGSTLPTPMDEVRNGLREEDYSFMPTPKDDTIGWCIWHTARIEDIAMNVLVENGSQVLDGEWLVKLGTTLTDTGNAMTDEEIIHFSEQVNKDMLWEYRCQVGIRTRSMLKELCFEDMKRRPAEGQLDRLLAEGCLTEQEDSIWLKDFWARKNVAGLLAMPVTRHQSVHLNDCLKLKKKCERR